MALNYYADVAAPNGNAQMGVIALPVYECLRSGLFERI